MPINTGSTNSIIRLAVEPVDKAMLTFTSLGGACADVMLRGGLFVAVVPLDMSFDPPGDFKVCTDDENI